MATPESAVSQDDNPLFDLQRTIYSSKNYTRRRLHQIRLQWVTKAIQKYAPVAAGAPVIEYGPGSGIYLPILARYCEEVIGADIETAYLSGIEPLRGPIGNLRLVVDNIEGSGFKDDTFGLVLCSEVLEHVPDPKRALRTIHRILQPGGIAIVTTPQRYSLMELSCKVAFLPGVITLVRHIYQEPVLETGHISLCSARRFQSLLRECGLQVVEESKFGLYVPLVAELGGNAGGRMIAALEARMGRPVFDWMLWTQAYVLRKPAG